MAADLSPIAWQDSHAKTILTQEILEGKVTEHSNFNDVYYGNEEYMLYDLKKFKPNAKRLVKSLNKHEALAKFDSDAIAHDRELHPRPAMTSHGIPFWDTSPAKPLLESDINNGINLTMTPLNLWSLREEYQMFPLDTFRGHINQEKKKRLKSSFWLKKAAKK